MPPKRKKQQPRNAYAIFVDDYLERQQADGYRITRQQAFTEASAKWNSLPRERKHEFEERAREEKGMMRQNVGRIDCTGQPILAVQNEIEEHRREQGEKADIIQTIVSGKSVKDVACFKFCVISFNIFCRTENKEYVPAEVGLVEFSIAKGITQQYHAFIAPRQIPTGYTFKCQQHSDLTHRIPLADFELAQGDYNLIYRKIYEIINDSEMGSCAATGHGPTLFCLPEDIAVCEYLLNKLRCSSPDASPLPAIYDLTVLFLAMHLKVTNDPFSTGLAREFLNKPSFNYSPNISCEWHTEQDNQPHCSLGVAKRTCFLIADRLCPLYGITLIPQRHFPDNSASDVLYTSASPTPTFVSSRPSSLRSVSASNCSYVPKSSLAASKSGSYLPPTESVYVPSVASSVSSRISSQYASVASRPPSSSYMQATWGPVSNSSFTIDSADFPSISGGSRSGRDSAFSGITMSSQGIGDHNPVYSSEIASVNSGASTIGESENGSRVRVPNSSPLVMNNLRGIGRGRPRNT